MKCHIVLCLCLVLTFSTGSECLKILKKIKDFLHPSTTTALPEHHHEEKKDHSWKGDEDSSENSDSDSRSSESNTHSSHNTGHDYTGIVRSTTRPSHSYGNGGNYGGSDRPGYETGTKKSPDSLTPDHPFDVDDNSESQWGGPKTPAGTGQSTSYTSSYNNRQSTTEKQPSYSNQGAGKEYNTVRPVVTSTPRAAIQRPSGQSTYNNGQTSYNDELTTERQSIKTPDNGYGQSQGSGSSTGSGTTYNNKQSTYNNGQSTTGGSQSTYGSGIGQPSSGGFQSTYDNDQSKTGSQSSFNNGQSTSGGSQSLHDNDKSSTGSQSSLNNGQSATEGSQLTHVSGQSTSGGFQSTYNNNQSTTGSQTSYNNGQSTPIRFQPTNNNEQSTMGSQSTNNNYQSTSERSQSTYGNGQSTFGSQSSYEKSKSNNNNNGQSTKGPQSPYNLPQSTTERQTSFGENFDKQNSIKTNNSSHEGALVFPDHPLISPTPEPERSFEHPDHLTDSSAPSDSTTADPREGKANEPVAVDIGGRRVIDGPVKQCPPGQRLDTYGNCRTPARR